MKRAGAVQRGEVVQNSEASTVDLADLRVQ